MTSVDRKLLQTYFENPKLMEVAVACVYYVWIFECEWFLSISFSSQVFRLLQSNWTSKSLLVNRAAQLNVIELKLQLEWLLYSAINKVS